MTAVCASVAVVVLRCMSLRRTPCYLDLLSHRAPVWVALPEPSFSGDTRAEASYKVADSEALELPAASLAMECDKLSICTLNDVAAWRLW